MPKIEEENILSERFTKEEYLKRLSDLNKSLLLFKNDKFTTDELLVRRKELEIILNHFKNKEFNSNKCKVCGKEFLLKKENKYFVIFKNPLLNVTSTCEAFDCEYCGCQNVVNSYAQKLK